MNKIRLQSIGWVDAEPAKNIIVGNVLMWNFGSTTIVKEVNISKTGKTLEIIETSSKNGKDYKRRLGSERLVCIKKSAELSNK